MHPSSVTSARPSLSQHRLVLPLLLVLLAFTCVLFSAFTCDDSYITFRYALNAATGQGLVFNPGERVEGFSNPLWLGLLIVAAGLGFGVIGTAKVLGLLSTVGAVLFAHGIVRKLDRDGQWHALVVLPLCAPGLAYFSMSGLETSMYACLLTGAVYCLLRRTAAGQWGMALLALAAALTRPEGVLGLLALLTWRLIQLRALGDSERRAVVVSTMTSLALLACFFFWRFSYFGSWLPNTYYAKPPGAFGGTSTLAPLTYIRDYLLSTGAWVWLALALVWLKPARLAAGAMLMLVAAETALVVHARGDWMALHRFLVPITPILVAFGYAGLLRLVPSKLVVGGVLALVLTLNGIQIAEQLRDFLYGQYPQAVMAGRPQQEAGEWLREHFPPDTTLATKRIGGIAFFSGMRIVDMLGLVDRKIAAIRHRSPERGEQEHVQIGQEVFSRKPDLILLCTVKRWHHVPPNQPAPDIVNNLGHIDNVVYADLEKRGYRFLYRLPQGNSGELAIYARSGFRRPDL